MDVGSWLAKSSAGEGRKSESCVMARGLGKHLLVKVASFVEKLTISRGNPTKKGLNRFGTILNQKVEFGQLLFTKVSPFSDGKIELNVHDTDPLELSDLITQVATHPANLPIQSLFEDNPKLKLVDGFDRAGSGYRIQDGHARTHPLHETRMQGFVHSHHIFLFMVVF